MIPQVAVVGAGAWGKNHVRTLHQLGALAGVVETNPDLRDKFRQDYGGIRIWRSLEEALPHVPGVVIATPASTHGALASLALEAGIGVLVEKPMTLGVEEAEALAGKARQTGGTLMVGHLLIYQPAVQKLKELLDAGTIGRVFRIHQERLNLGRVRESENVLWSLGPHDVAVLLFLMGEAPQEVAAAGASFLQPGIHDDVHVELRFPGERSAHIHAAWYWPEQRRCLRVFGETGMIVYDEAQQTLTLHRKHLAGGEGQGRLATVNAGESLLFQGSGEPLRLEDQHFLTCLATGARPLSHGDSGVDVIRVLARADHQLKQALLAPAKERS